MTELVVDEQTPPAPRSRLGDCVSQPRNLWLTFFAYAVVAAGLVQLVVLP